MLGLRSLTHHQIAIYHMTHVNEISSAFVCLFVCLDIVEVYEVYDVLFVWILLRFMGYF